MVVVKTQGFLTDNHVQDFQLQFTFPHRTMLHEPLLLVAAFFLLFLLSILYVRLDFSITVDENAEAKMKVAGYYEKVAAHQDSCSGLYQALDDAIVKLKANKDMAAFQAALKKISSDHKAESAAISDLQAVIKAVNPDLAEKVSELQRVDKILRDFQAQQVALVEKLIAGKLVKQAFIDQEAVVNNKKDKISAIFRSL